MAVSFGASIERGAVRSVDLVSMHAHQHCELFFLLSGRRRYFVGHTIYQVDPGDMVIVPPNQLHRTTQSNTADYERYLINFRFQDHCAFFESIGKDAVDALLFGGCMSFPPAVVRNIRQLLEQIECEQNKPTNFAKPVISNLLQNIMLQILRHGVKKEPYHGEGADKVQQVARHISYHYDEVITLKHAAAMAMMESTYFSKQFKALTGFGFHKYLTHVRLQAAEQLLKETKLSMSEVAEQCGFSEANHFGNVFSRWMGISPSAYRKSFSRDN